MNCKEVLNLLESHSRETRERFGVKSLSVFGSVARDEAGEASDVDLLVEFDGPADYERYSGLRFYLEDILGLHIDLVTTKALRPRLRPAVEREAIRIA